jgi:hypothetical protein
MPDTLTKDSSTGLFFPGAAQRSGSLNEDSPLHAQIERTMEEIEAYARREPWAFATWVFGVGFVLGWKLKPW